MLRRVMLAVSASDRIRDVVTTAPFTKDVVARFVAGATQDDALRVTRELLEQGLLVTLDHLGEHTTDPEQAAAAADQYISLLGRLADGGHARAGRAEVSVKPTAVGLGLKEHGDKTARENITRICAAAAAAGTTVTMDMEDHHLVEPTVRLLHELRAEFPDLGCVIQSYLRRSEADCGALAGSRVRLCKGAYDAPEEVAFTDRRQVDLSYVRCLRALLAGPGYPMLATHDPRLIEIIQAQAILAGRAADSFEYQMLYGIRPAEQRRLANQGSRVRVYVPYGSDWYGYLTRRLIERPANLTFFLRSLASRR
ncbi:MAG TPA: proline dehydrogenase family protein [Streptosporangiaceae bacterium]|nr:proline dehydrogenase family protein [Streptosporangiaceae bacterium]